MTIQRDTFTDVDGTILELHVADTGFNWENFNPFHPTNAEIQGNALLGAEGFFRAFRTDFVPDEGDSVGLIFEVFNVADHDGIFIKLNIATAGDIRFGYQIGWRNESTSVNIEIAKDDNFLTNDVDLPVTTLGTHILQAQVVEGRIRVWLDGELVAWRTDPTPLPAGRHGLEILRSVGEVGCRILEWAYPATAITGNTLTENDLNPHRVSDTFTDVDGTDVQDHVPDSDVPFTWLTHPEIFTGDLPIDDNAVAFDGNGIQNGGMVHTGIAPGTGLISVEVNLQFTEPGELTHRLDLWLLASLTAESGYRLRFDDINNLLSLDRMDAGVNTFLASVAIDRDEFDDLGNLRLDYDTDTGVLTGLYNGLPMVMGVDGSYATSLVSSGFDCVVLSLATAHLRILDFGITSEVAPGGEVILPPIPVNPVEDVILEEPFCQGITITQDQPAEVVFDSEAAAPLTLSENEPCGTPVDLSGPFARCDHAEFIVLPL